MAQSITDVAAYILERTGTITTMQLHQLAFYAQTEHLVRHQGAPLFPEDFYAWRSGPVAPLLFILHRNKFIIRPGELPQGDPDRLSDDEKNSSFASALLWVKQPESALNSVSVCVQKTRGCTHEAT